MEWVFKLIIFQIVFAEILTLVLYIIWRLSNPGRSW